MKRFLLAVTLCFSLLLIGLFCFLPETTAQILRSDSGNLSGLSLTETRNILPLLLDLPAPPPPNPFFQPNSSIRDENFFDKGNPPKSDAPIDDLLEYWKRQNQLDPKYTYAPKPDEKSLERLMAEVEKKPETLAEMVNVFPDSSESAEFVKRLYDEENSQRKYEASWRSTVKSWLTYHSNYFSDELYQIAGQSAETEEYVTNQDEVLALAKVDWDKAQPLLERMLNNSQQPVSQTLARWAFYKHALKNGDSLDADKYRRELQETVENKSLQAGNRDLAMDALVREGDFQGRDDWYYSLLEDETLYELRVNGQLYTGLTTILQLSPDDKYVAKMIELAGNSNPTIRNAAVRNLSTLLDTNKNPEVIKALIPWLEDPKWAKEVNGERAKIVAALRNFEIPESVPGLIAMLNEKEKREIYPSNGSSNVAVYANRAANVSGRTDSVSVDAYPFRSFAIVALAKQKSPLAAGALRQVLPFVEEWERQTVVAALLASNGFTIGEQVDALEEVAKNVRQDVNASSNIAVANNPTEYAPQISTNTTVYKPQSNPNDLKLFLGAQLARIEDPSDELVKAVLSRISFLEKKNPPVADNLRLIIQNWKGTAINSLVLKDLKDGKTNVMAIIKLLTIRKDLREKQLNDVNDIRAGSPTALGISACLLEQTSDFDAILQSDNTEAKVAMLGCARLIRAPLPVQKVAVNLKSQNKLLALAAERYLESEDSPEARQIVLSIHPNEAKILGARVAFIPDGQSAEGVFLEFTHALFVSVDSYFEKLPPYFFYSYTDDDSTEKTLQKEVKENQELLGIYAYDDNFVRIYKDKAVFNWQDDPARYRERDLSGEEFEGLKNFLAAQRVDELPPFLANCEGCQSKELLMLGRGGGRRIFVKAESLPPFFTELENIFTEFRRQPAQIHYYFEKDVAGLEILYADDNLNAITVWKNGDDFRLLTDDLTLHKKAEKETEELNSERQDLEVSEEDTEVTAEQKAEMNKERLKNEDLARQKQFSSYAWYKFDKTKLLEPVAQPESLDFIPRVDAFAVPPDEKQWKARAANVEIRADQEGLYKITGGNFKKIRDGFYFNPLVTPNGRWALATKYTEGGDGISLVRVNLTTNKELKIAVKSDYNAPEAVAFIPALNKVLLFSGYGEGDGEGEYKTYEREGEFFLLDPETGLVQPVKGEARPFLQQTFRPLQTVAANPETVWAVFPDTGKNATQFGIYNTKTLSFKVLMTIPKIIFSSMEMWVDESEAKIYFVYEGQLLALPLPKGK